MLGASSLVTAEQLLRSPSSDRPGEVRQKIEAWRECGVTLIWVVDPRRLTVAAHHADGSAAVIGQDGEIDGGMALPGFRTAVQAFFE